VRFEILTTVKMLMLVFWVVTQYRLVRRYQRFWVSALKMEAVYSSETLVSTCKSARRGVTTQKTNIETLNLFVPDPPAGRGSRTAHSDTKG
jgi:hypothetical protein